MSTINVIEDSDTDEVEEIDVVDHDIITLDSMATNQPMQHLNTNTSVVEINRTYVNDSEDDDDDEDYMKARSKIPRLHSNQDIKSVNTNTKENKSPEQEEEICSICLEPWTNSGIHRIVCLKCGHLFGEGCIERWLRTNQKCPQCNHPSKKTDIRRIYARAIKILDTSELEKALKDLEHERQQRKKAEINASELKLNCQAIERSLAIMTSNYKNLLEQFNQQKLQQAASGSSSSQSSGLDAKSSAMKFAMEKMFNITDANGGCRIVAFSARYTAILVSQPSNNSIFPGFGIKKINFLDYKLSQYVPIHSKLIRDMALNNTQQDDGIILTCGLDKTIRLTNLANNALVHSFECAHPVWSCAYNTDNPMYFFAGLANGHVLLFDKRRIDRQVDILNSVFDMGSPVCSLQYVPKNEQASFSQSGLLVAQLDKLSFFECKQPEEYKYHPLLVESNIMSCNFEPVTRHVLLSTRPTQKHPTVRHLVYEFSPSSSQDTAADTMCSLNLSQTYSGSNVQKMLAKSKLFTYDTQLYGCAPDEASKSVLIWDVNKNELCTKLANASEVLDICPISYNNSSFIVSLTDKQLRVFKKSN